MHFSVFLGLSKTLSASLSVCLYLYLTNWSCFYKSQLKCEQWRNSVQNTHQSVIHQQPHAFHFGPLHSCAFPFPSVTHLRPKVTSWCATFLTLVCIVMLVLLVHAFACYSHATAGWFLATCVQSISKWRFFLWNHKIQNIMWIKLFLIDYYYKTL